MIKSNAIELRAPYLIFNGDVLEHGYCKTGFGIVQWCPERVTGQLRLSEQTVDLGVQDLSIQQAVAAGVKSLVIGVAPVGGAIPENWLSDLEEAAQSGLDLVSGLHHKLAEYANLVSAAEQSGARLVDIRIPPQKIPIGSGAKRTGKRILMVGTDCAVGKKYTALGLQLALQKRGMKATFRATGQTGIMIAGQGIPIDSVVSDFISGAAEMISPSNDDDHWDVIEGQGSIFHPGYAGVSLGLLHGSQPDALVLCHDAVRSDIIGFPGYHMPSIEQCIDLNLQMGRLTNPNIRCVGISVNSSGLLADKRDDYMDNLTKQYALPCIDPLVEGMDLIVDNIQQQFV